MCHGLDDPQFQFLACQVVKLQLSQLGLDSEFLPCEIQAPNENEIWNGVRRRYWHGRDVYYLPKVTWNDEFLGRKVKATNQDVAGDEMQVEEQSQDTKRQRRIL